MMAGNEAVQPETVRKPGKKAGAVAALVLLVVAGAVAGQRIYAGYQHSKAVSEVIDSETFYPGIIVQGVDLGGKSMEEAEKSVNAALPGTQQVEIQISGNDRTWSLTDRDLSFQYDTDEVLKEAYAYARSGDREQRYRQVKKLKQVPKKYTVTGTVEEASLKTALDAIADEADVAPKSPGVTAFDPKTKKFTYCNGTNGILVNRDKLLSDVKNVLQSGGAGQVTLSTETVPFHGTLSDLKAHMKKLGTFSTTSKNSANGTYNMTRALLSANGVCVEPGATFSFFATASECGQAQGYKPAGAILNGKLVQEYGGGICQASTTIYGAAARSGMEITERYNHSIPSSYCKIGQDATVSYPNLDFKFENPADYPVYLSTTVKNKVLTVTFYGYQPDDYNQIQVSSQVTETIPAPTKAQYTLDSTLKKGAVRLDSKARTGYRVKARRIYLKNGSQVKTEELPSSYYRPQPAYYSYGKGTDVAKSTAGSSSSSAPASKPASSSSSSTAAPASEATSSAPPSSSQTESSEPTDLSSSSTPAGTSAPQPKTGGANDDVTAEGEPAA